MKKDEEIIFDNYFGDKVSHICEVRGMSMDNLAKKAGVTTTEITECLEGVRVLRRICDTLQFDAGYFVPEPEELRNYSKVKEQQTGMLYSHK